MSALALPVPLPAPARRARPAANPRRGHLELVGPGFIPAPAEPVPAATAPEAVPAAAPAAARPALRLTARGRMVRSVAALLLAGGVAVGAGAWLGTAVNAGNEYDGPTATVSVGAGQTLWQIASASAANGQDVRQVVEQIQVLNGLSTASLAVGQQLVVPAG